MGQLRTRMDEVMGDVHEAGQARSATTPFSPKTSTASVFSGGGTHDP